MHRRLRAPIAVLALGFFLVSLAAAESGEDGLPPPRLTETAWTLSLAFEDDVQKGVFDAWGKRMQAASELLFELTEGQIHIAACFAEDKTSAGDILVLTGLSDKSVIPEADAMAQVFLGGTPAWCMFTAGDPDGKPGMLWKLGSVVVHELGHAVFGLPDERDNERVAGMECPNCIMGTDPARLCGPDTHKGSVKKSCKEVISALYGGKVKFPNPAYRRGSAPPKLKFTVTDRDSRHPGRDLEPLSAKDQAVVQELRRFGRAFDVTVAFEGRADKALIARWKRNLVVMDRILRRLIAGQFIIATCSIEQGKSEGTFVIEKGAEAQSVLVSNADSMWSRTEKGWLCAGMVPPEGLARYLFCEWLKVQESDPACKCFLNLGNWEYPPAVVLCSKQSHSGGGSPCEERLANAWKDSGVAPPSTIKKIREWPCTRFVISEK